MYVTYDGVIAHLNESCHIWMSHVAYEWVMSPQHLKPRDLGQSHAKYASSVLCVLCGSRPSKVCHVSMSHVTSERVMSNTNESCHIWRSHVTDEWVIPHTNESSHVWMSDNHPKYVSCMLCVMYAMCGAFATCYSSVWHVSPALPWCMKLEVDRHTDMCGTLSSLMCGTLLLGVTLYIRMSFNVSLPISTERVPHISVCLSTASFLRNTTHSWLVHMCNMIHSYVTWHVDMW